MSGKLGIWYDLVTVWRQLSVVTGNRGVSESTANGIFVLDDLKVALGQPNWKSWTAIERKHIMRDPIHPGKTLREDLDALGLSATALARRIEVPVNRMTGILNGRCAITGDTALRLGHFFGSSSEFWLSLQKLYGLRLAQRKNILKSRVAP